MRICWLRPICYGFHCIGKVDKNELEHTRVVEKKKAGDTREVKDDHLHFTQLLGHIAQQCVCKQNLISSTSHTVPNVHTRKVGLAAFDKKRWLCEDTAHTHS